MIDCFGATTDRRDEIITRTNYKGFGGGVSPTPLVISSLEIPTPFDKRCDKSDHFCSPGSKLGIVGATARGLSQSLL